VQNGAGKFNRKNGDIKKCNQIGWLFSQLSLYNPGPFGEAELNRAVWKIMKKGTEL
jgi:hypothetical protein